MPRNNCIIFPYQVCNKEILEQNQLRTDLHDWGRQLCEQLVETEAKLCQAKSERDFLLNEKRKARQQNNNNNNNDSNSNNNSIDGSTEDVLERMIEDAMEEAVIDGGGGGRGGSRKTKKAATDNAANLSADSPSQLESSFKLERYTRRF